VKVNKVSIITVCLNTRDTIRLTLNSVSRQKGITTEHIVIDGGSTDGTQSIVDEYSVAYFVSEKDEGVYDAMEKGSRAATGDIVIFLNSGDVFYDENTCASVSSFFEKNNADIVFGNLLPVYLSSADTHDHDSFVAGNLLDLGYMRNRRQLFNESIHHQATFYRRWVLKKCSFFCKQFPEASGEYNVLLNAVMKRRARVKHIPLPVSRFVLGGISTRNFQLEWDKYVRARKFLRSLYCPSLEAIRVKDENEFCASEQSTMPFAAKIKTRVKGYVKRSLIYRVYNRLMNSLTARVFDALMPTITDLLELQTQRVFNDLNAVNKYTNSQITDLVKGVSTDNSRLAGCVMAHIEATINNHHQFMTSLETLRRGNDQLLANVESLSGGNDQLLTSVESLRGGNDQLLTSVESLRVVQNQCVLDANRHVSNTTVGLAQIALTINPSSEFSDHGYKAYSQWDEDGLIQYLISNCKKINKSFVEIGTGDYTEANTRLLLEKDNWRGMILDSSTEYMDKVKSSDLYWRYSLKAVDVFIDSENVNQLLSENGFEGEIGLLSIDIDGVDYWLWKAINTISPQIVVCEYNGIFGSIAKVTVPYDAKFDRTKKHFSWLYAGASLSALESLALEKGYTLIGTNSGGNNAFFLRNDVLEKSTVKVSVEKYTKPKFRESRTANGELSYLDITEGLGLIENMKVYDIEQDKIVQVSDISISYDN